MLEIVEFVHDFLPRNNLDLWTKEYNHRTQRINVCEDNKFVGSQLIDNNNFDLLIVHGGNHHVWDKDTYPWIIDEINYVRELLNMGKPVIGFCLGSQILAEVLDAESYPAKQYERGWIYVKTEMQHNEAKYMLKDMPNEFITFAWHEDHYTLPQDCVRLGHTDAAQNQMFVCKIKPAIGFQFHAEYSMDVLNDYIADYDMSQDELNLILKILEEGHHLPHTYKTFKKIMNNSINWLSENFNRQDLLTKHKLL